MGQDLNPGVSLQTMAMAWPTAVPEDHWWLLGPLGGGVQAVQAWGLSSGAGLRIGLVDTGMNTAHSDFRPGTALPIGAAPPTGAHGTQVAGLITGRTDNTIAGMGIAPDAILIPTTIDFDNAISISEIAQTLTSQSTLDVSNNSWGFVRAFSDNFRDYSIQPVADAILTAATVGRDGLGTVMVFAAGNSRLMIDGVNRGGDSNFHNLTNARQTIAVGASDANGEAALFSSPGTNLLISAPGLGLVSADGLEAGASDMKYVSGTSFSAPLVSGTTALMLEVNPDLGYRDVQEILALTARPTAPPEATTGPGFFNGGALMHDRDLGFGVLDAEAAVRLARSWSHVQTAESEAHLAASFGYDYAPDPTMHEMQLTLAAPEDPFHLQWVELTLTLNSADLADLRIELIAPSGTVSLIAPNLAPLGGRSALDFTFSTAANWGEGIAGDWTLRLSHPDPAERFYIFEASLDLHGDARVQDEHVLTPVYADLLAQDPTRATLQEGSALNLAALDRAAHVDLESGTGQIGTANFQFDTTIHHIQASDHGDVLNGSAENDHFIGGMGDDTIFGGDGGDDFIFGTAGENLLRGGAGSSTIHGGTDKDVIAGNAGRDFLRGGAGDDRIFGGAGHDTIAGNSGNDRIDGGTGADRIFGGAGEDTIFGGAGDDLLWGGSQGDELHGGAGADTFIWRQAAHSNPTHGADRIMDFTPGEDLLDLTALDLDTRVSGDFTGQAGDWRYTLHEDSPARLEADTDGDGETDFAVDFWNNPLLSVEDMLL